ncbi:LCP family protein [Nocardioides sp. NPDC092400]|uniref:LCP family protein n=1 Tax=Nocardioides sp. NPDC092400 TaxID=3155196 RepID=UPI003427F4DF
MADRPRNGGPEDGSREYGWLYGGKQPREPGPEETRVMPVQPRDGGRSRAVPGQPAQPPRPAQPVGRDTPPGGPATSRPRGAGVPSGPASPATRERRGFRFPRPRLRWVFLLVLAWIAYLVIVPVMAWNDVDKVDFEPDGDRPGDQPGTTYLMVGSDSRGDLSPEERKRLGTGGAEGQRTDTIMLLHTGSGPNLLMSIPRDSNVEIPGRGLNKINAAYAFGGPKLLVQTIEQSTGIRVDDYVEIGMGGLAGVVDAVGGIEICPENAMKDPQAKLDIEAGCQEADGPTALGYARSRKTYTRFGDTQRAQAQREVVSAVGKKVVSPWTVLNPFRYWDLNHSVPGFFAFGEGTGPLRAGMWAMAMTRVNGESGLTCGVPISDLAVTWDPERSEQMFQAIIEDDTDSIPRKLCTPTGLPKEVTG